MQHDCISLYTKESLCSYASVFAEAVFVAETSHYWTDFSGSSALCLYFFFLLNRVEKEKNALQSEGDDLAVSLETLQKQKVSIFIGHPSLETEFLIAKHSLWLFPRFSFQNQSDKQNRALEEQLSDNKYQVS